MTRMKYVPDGVTPGSKNWPVVLAFAVLMEQQMEAHSDRDTGGGRNWQGDDPKGLMLHLLEEVKELDDVVAAHQHGVLGGGVEGDIRVRKESADVGNLAMMVADRLTGLSPVTWPVRDNPDPFSHLISHDIGSERTAGMGPHQTCPGAELSLMALVLRQIARRATTFWSDTLTEQQHQLVGIADVLTRLGVQLCDEAVNEATDAMRAGGEA